MLSRRGLITGLVSLIAAPAIVRASSLDVIRGKPLNTVQLMATEWDGAYREITLGYTITRESIENNLLYGLPLARLKSEGQPFYEDPFDDPDTATLWGDPDLAGLQQWS